MPFHEDQFPLPISYGSTGGPGFKTDIVETDSGNEQRVSRWDGSRHRFNAAERVRSAANLALIKNFYMARKGAAYGCRYKDWSDYTTASDHRSAHTHLDHLIGTGDGTTTTFQLIKRYTSGGAIQVRNIVKPVFGQVRISFGAVEQTTGWSVNTATGIVTFSTAPPLATEIFAGCQFDVPVRLGIEVDDLLAISLDDFGHGSIPDIPLVEIFDGLMTRDEYPYGGSTTYSPMTEHVSVVEGNGRVLVFNPTVASRRVYLPVTTGLPPGAPYFFIVNTNVTNNLSIRDNNQTQIYLLAAAPAGGSSIAEVLLGSSAWYVG